MSVSEGLYLRLYCWLFIVSGIVGLKRTLGSFANGKAENLQN